MSDHPDSVKRAEGKTPWRALTAAWLGWCFDGLDGYLYIMVAMPFLQELVAKAEGVSVAAVRADPGLSARATEQAAAIQAVFFVGWALGGAVFGRLGDRLGRARTLTLTIVTYAAFTGLSFFATSWWHLLIFRFLAALGIGGEWAAGSALVSETLHSKHRAWASALLQSGYMVGCILAALTAGWMAHLEPRWVFLVGVLPAVLTIWIRKAVPEPEQWQKAAGRETPPPVGAIFSKRLRVTTVMTIALTGIALTTVWSFLYFVPQAVQRMPEVKSWSPAEVRRLTTNVAVAYFVVNIAGNFFATYLAKAVGYRKAFAGLFAASLACFMLLYREPLTLGNVYWVTGVTAFFSLGLFGLFPLYIPPLFPTLVRTLGAGFTYNAGRLMSALGAFFGGIIAVEAGGPHRAIFWTGLLYVPGLLVGGLCPVPRHEDETDEVAL